MLQYKKNKLINLLLQFEIYLIDCAICDVVGDAETPAHIKKLPAPSQAESIIHRNIQSIKKQIKHL